MITPDDLPVEARWAVIGPMLQKEHPLTALSIATLIICAICDEYPQDKDWVLKAIAGGIDVGNSCKVTIQ